MVSSDAVRRLYQREFSVIGRFLGFIYFTSYFKLIVCVRASSFWDGPEKRSTRIRLYLRANPALNGCCSKVTTVMTTFTTS